MAGEQYGYAFDALGNRVQTSVNSRVAKYFANAVNELTQREVPGAFDVLGTANAGATVSVNGQLTVRHDRSFAATVPVENVAQAQEVPVTITAANGSGTTSQSHRFFVPQTPENFTYDPDGNLTSDGHWSYRWDAEPRPMGKRRDRQKVLTFCPLGCRGREAARHQNRLVGVESLPVVPTLDRVRLVFGYDAQSRRVRKEVWTWDPGQNGWALHHTFLFVYDGWNLLAELSASGRPVRSYTWGQDVSGSPQGAGGIGGLLWEQDLLGGQTGAATYDLQGNLTALLETRTGQPFAQYAYGPFGEPIRTTGEYAELNPFRFSTKYTDLETGLAYYGYRYYQPQMGRWLNRDPKAESGGLNLYSFVSNSPITKVDPFGLAPAAPSGRWYTHGPYADAYGLVPWYLTAGWTSPYLIGGAVGTSVEVVFDCRDGSANAFATVMVGLGIGSPGFAISTGKGLNFIYDLATATDYAGHFVAISGSLSGGAAGGYATVFTTPQGAANLFTSGNLGGQTWGWGAGWAAGTPSGGVLVQWEYFWDLGKVSFSSSLRSKICRCSTSAAAGGGYTTVPEADIKSAAKSSTETIKNSLKSRIATELNWIPGSAEINSATWNASF